MKIATRALLVSILIASSTKLMADYEQSYRDGVTAYSKKRWQDTITAMKAAIRERPAESAKVVAIYGTWYEPYIPHYYLGMALSKAGACAEAVKELRETQKQGVLPRRYMSEVEEVLSQCADAEPPVPSATTATPKVPEPVTQTTQTLSGAPPPTAALETASAPKGEPPRPTTETRAPESKPKPRETPAGPPRDLIAGVDAYLRGDYAAALTVLQKARFTDDRSRAQALLFRAAAAHALFVIGRGAEKSLEDRALSDAREYKRLQRNRAPDARVFSPAFVRFVQQAGARPLDRTPSGE